MLRLRQGDIWKAVLLVAAIVGVAAFGIYNVTRFTRTTRPAPARAQAAPQAAATAASPGTEMFAQQQGAAAALLAQARLAPDPFRPAVALESHQTASPAAPPKEKEPTRVRPLPALPGDETETTRLELLGIVSGDSPLAVLGDGKQRYYVRTGDKVVDGWIVAAIRGTRVTLSKDRAQVTLPLVAPPS
jgi:hypothetical protein